MTSFDACPKCSHPAAPGGLDCPACGIVYSKYRGRATARPAASATVADATADPFGFNPYAPPESEVTGLAGSVYAPAVTGDVWRSGTVLVMTKDAALPDRCVRCNRPAQVRLPRKLSWHRPWIYLTILISILVYLVIALVARKKARVEVPLCSEHERQRKNRLGTGWIVVLCSMLLGAVGLGSPDHLWLLGVAPFTLLAGLIFVTAVSQPVTPKKIDDHHVWLRKVSPEFLADLPRAPGHLALG